MPRSPPLRERSRDRNSRRRSRSPARSPRRYKSPQDDRDSRRRQRSYSRDRRRRSRSRDGGGPRDRYREDRSEGANHRRRGGSTSRRSPSPATRALALQTESDAAAIAAAQPNFKASGKLAAETNTFKGVVLKYHEPPEARKPTGGWRLYVFKGKQELDCLHIHRQSAYLIGRDRVVSDIPVDHPSTSKQHAVIQFRQVHERNEFGDSKATVKPFLIDLESANGTLVNDEKLPASRYYELKSGDVIKFAFSTREYVLLVE